MPAELGIGNELPLSMKPRKGTHTRESESSAGG
jgi:hypothetical protein